MRKMNRKQLEQNKRKLENEKEKKEYIAQMRKFANMLGGEGTFALFPQQLIENSYQLRILPLKMVVNNRVEISEKDHRRFWKSMKNLLKMKQHYFKFNDMEIDTEWFICAGLNILNLVDYSIQYRAEEPWSIELSKRIAPDIKQELFEKSYVAIYDVASFLYFWLYRFDDSQFWFNFELKKLHEDSKHLQNVMEVNAEAVEPRYFTIGTNKRPAYKIGWPQTQTGIDYIEISPSLFGSEFDGQESVPVYIQTHALNRMEERLDSLNLQELISSVYASLLKPVAVRKEKCRILLSYRILETKMGYFTAQYIDGAVLIHTFLFITNNGTPEGEKLNELTGLGKLDKKYLTIDKLSTFINSDISTNEKLKNLFIKAGCNSLLEIDEAVKAVAKKQQEMAISDMILNYIGK
jgi:hypothetical protein